MNKILFTFGDYSSDGHGKSATVMIDSEISLDVFNTCCKEIVSHLPFSFNQLDENSILSEHEENDIPLEVSKWLIDNGIESYYESIEFSFLDYYDDNSEHGYGDNLEDIICYGTDVFAYIYLFCVAKTHEKIYGTLPKLFIDEKFEQSVQYVGYGIFD